jgi:hypothetical protein
MVTFRQRGADDHRVWWVWVLGVLAVWFVVAALVAVLIGRGIRLADRRSPGTGVGMSTADLPAGFVPAPAPAPRRAVPLPPIGVGLAAVAVALESIGYLGELNGGAARLLSMDAPFSLPRMYVAALFAVAALLAVAGAGRLEGRRTWWLAVALVAGGIASVKAGGTVHSDALGAVGNAWGTRAAVVLSVLVAVAVVAVLWFLSRTERRDRRRVLGTLAGYAVASVGLSAVSGAVPAGWLATATFVEESGEALAGVTFLMAVLVGVAPRLVLPASWPLRRTADAQTLDAAVPARAADTR